MWKEENIAVTKARQEKEQMKAEERKKKLAEQHEAIRKETEKINSQIGDGRGDNREWRQGGGRHDERGRQWPGNQVGFTARHSLYLLSISAKSYSTLSSCAGTTSQFCCASIHTKRWRAAKRAACCTAAKRWSRPQQRRPP